MRTMLCGISIPSMIILFFAVSEYTVASGPVEGQLEKSKGDSSFYEKYPVMVPVSSTVIPLLHLFGKPKPLRSGTPRPRSSTLYLSPERRARLLERSNRPDAPVRLITKNSRQKDANNETH